jgi:hypothetical protein
MYGETLTIVIPGIHNVTATQPVQSAIQNFASTTQTTKSYVTDNHTQPQGTTRSRIQNAGLIAIQGTTSRILLFFTVEEPENGVLAGSYMGGAYMAQGNAQQTQTTPLYLDNETNELELY